MTLNATSLALGVSALVATAPVSAASVVASIKPVELLVKAVAGDSVDVTTLVPPGSSPHNYSMKPSQRRALEDADAIFWVGPDMETFLQRLLGSHEFEGRVVAFTGDSEHQEEKEEDGHHHGHDAHDHDEDPHIWVDPQLALEMAHVIHDRLVTLDDLDKQQLNDNLQAFERELQATEQRINEQLVAVQDTSLFAYHSAFTRFAEHYDLHLDGVLTLNPELSPGARHIAEVQEKLQRANRPCLLTEPQFDRQWWRSITEGMNVTFSTWDPLATDIESNQQGYINFQNSIAEAVLKCSPE